MQAIVVPKVIYDLNLFEFNGLCVFYFKVP